MSQQQQYNNRNQNQNQRRNGQGQNPPSGGSSVRPPATSLPALPGNALQPGMLGYVMPAPAYWEYLKEMGRYYFSSGLIPSTVKNAEAAAIIAMRSYELGIPISEGFAELYVVNGKVAMSVSMMQKIVGRNAPELRYRVHDDVDQAGVPIQCTVEGQKPGWQPYKVTFTWADAKRAQLTGKENWQKYPRAMLRARALSEFFRAYVPDALRGVSYTPDELDAIETTGRNLGPEPEPVREPKDVPNESQSQPAAADPHAAAAGGSPEPAPGAAVPPSSPTEPGADGSGSGQRQLTPRQALTVEAMRFKGWRGADVAKYLAQVYQLDSVEKLPEPAFEKLVQTVRELSFTDAMIEFNLALKAAQTSKPAAPAPEPVPDANEPSPIYKEIMDKYVTQESLDLDQPPSGPPIPPDQQWGAGLPSSMDPPPMREPGEEG